jgi:hypothetical protein
MMEPNMCQGIPRERSHLDDLSSLMNQIFSRAAYFYTVKYRYTFGIELKRF